MRYAMTVVLLVGLMIAPALAQQTTGLNVRMVDYGNGAFVQTGPKQWAEVNKSTWEPIATFEETGRDADIVRLFDRSRQIHIALHTAGGQILYAPDGSPLQPLYRITGLSDKSLIPGSQTAWDATPPPAPPPPQQRAAAPQQSGSLEQQCINAVQGKVAWNQAGSVNWGEENLRNLCRQTRNPAATIACFQNEIRAHNDWERAIANCSGPQAQQTQQIPRQQAAAPQQPQASRIIAGETLQPQQPSKKIEDDEKSPQIPDVLAQMKKLTPHSSELVETTIEDFVDTYDVNDEVGKGDHPQGITMTPSGRIVFNMSRGGGGVLIYSDPFEPGKDLSWKMMGGLASHPSAMQAVGDIVAVAETGKTRLFKLPRVGSSDAPQELTHLNVSGGEAVGITYNAKEDRYYAFAAGGSMTPSFQAISLCRTPEGASLLDESTRFGDCKNISGVAVSSQGSHLVTQDDGTMFVISTFSTTGEIEETSITGATGNDAVAEYMAQCVSQGVLAVSAGYDIPGSFRDWVAVTEIDYSGQAGHDRKGEDLIRTQRAQVCVNDRPAFRFGGAVAPVGYDGALMALWSGRFNTLSDTFSDDDFEFAYQRLTPKVRAASTSAKKAYFFLDDGEYVRYTDSGGKEGVDEGYPLPTARNWKTDDREVRAAVKWDDGYTYLFLEGGYYHRLEKDGTPSKGYPLKVTDKLWPGLEEYAEDIKAAVNWGNGNVYFFIDQGGAERGDYLRYSIKDNKVVAGPTLVEDGWGVLGEKRGSCTFCGGDDISAAVNWGNGTAYFFLENGQYVGWDINTNKNWVRSIQGNWPGMPDEEVTAAFRH